MINRRKEIKATCEDIIVHAQIARTEVQLALSATGQDLSENLNYRLAVERLKDIEISARAIVSLAELENHGS